MLTIPFEQLRRSPNVHTAGHLLCQQIMNLLLCPTMVVECLRQVAVGPSTDLAPPTDGVTDSARHSRHSTLVVALAESKFSMLHIRSFNGGDWSEESRCHGDKKAVLPTTASLTNQLTNPV